MSVAGCLCGGVGGIFGDTMVLVTTFVLPLNFASYDDSSSPMRGDSFAGGTCNRSTVSTYSRLYGTLHTTCDGMGGTGLDTSRRACLGGMYTGTMSGAVRPACGSLTSTMRGLRATLPGDMSAGGLARRGVGGTYRTFGRTHTL